MSFYFPPRPPTRDLQFAVASAAAVAALALIVGVVVGAWP